MDPYAVAQQPGRATRLTNRDSERAALDRLLSAVRAGESRVLVVRGDPGVGKTVLLDYVAERARGCRVVRAAGVQSEMELAFAGLHQLCVPMLDHLGRIPEPQRDALRTAFGVAAGSAPDRFLVGLAVLSLLSEAAADQPLVCLIDDAQWLDQASEQILGFVARRLGASVTSLTWPARPSGGSRAPRPPLPSARCIGFWMTPGKTALTRMPRDAYSMASARVAAARAPLVSAVSTAGVPESVASGPVAPTLTT